MLMRFVVCCCIVLGYTISTVSSDASEFDLYAEYFAPYTYKNENDEADGIAIALTRNVLINAGHEFEPEFVAWARAYKAVESQSNVFVINMARTEKRESLFEWVAPLVEGDGGILVYRKENPPQQPASIDELKSKNVCATPKNALTQALEKAGFVAGENLHEFQTLLPTAPAGEQFPVLQSKCEFLATHFYPFIELLEKRGYPNPREHFAFYPAPKGLFPSWSSYLVASKGTDPELLNSLRDSFEELRASGAQHKLCVEEANKHGFSITMCEKLEP